MRTYTNLAWPDDPYRTGQQLYPRPAPRLAAFAASPPGWRWQGCAAAVVYLPLHRTRPLQVTGYTVAFGFRAASASNQASACEVARVADLDLLQARRHAAVLAGHDMAADLAAVRAVAGTSALRGLDSVAKEWAARGTPARGKAAMVDCALDLPGGAPLEQACRQAHLTPPPGPATPPVASVAEEQAARAVAERALTVALIAARHLGRYTWDGTLNPREILAAAAWDCLPQAPDAPPPARPGGPPGGGMPAIASRASRGFPVIVTGSLSVGLTGPAFTAQPGGGRAA